MTPLRRGEKSILKVEAVYLILEKKGNHRIPALQPSLQETTMESGAPRFKVLMFPWLAHGHISPFFELSKRLAKNNFQVYFCSTEINLDFIRKNKCLNENSSDHPMELIQLNLPELPELPPHYQTTKSLPPHLMPTLRRAFQMAKPNFSTILSTLKPDLLIYDGFQPWAPELAASLSIPSVHFVTSSAVNLSFYHHLRKSAVSGTRDRYPFPAIFYRNYEEKKLLAIFQSRHGLENDFSNKPFELSSDMVLLRSCREIEGKYLDHFSSLSGKGMFAVGPLVGQEEIKDEEKNADYAHIIKFLDDKNESSVVYVSFGSEYFLNKEEREEIAHGLELSNANFIWVVRSPEGGNNSTEEALPEGFLERVKDRGIVVNGWAPQGKILEHSSTGGFVSHCGWGSFLESLYYGVPLIAMPMHADQPLNARLSLEIGVGIEVSREEDGQIKRGEVAKIIRMVVIEKKVEHMRQKARELSKKLREVGEEELHQAVDKLRDKCSNKNK